MHRDIITEIPPIIDRIIEGKGIIFECNLNEWIA